MKKLYLCWTLLGLLFAPFIWAQNSVTGTVNDETYLYLAFHDKNQKNQLGYLIPVFEKNIIKLLKRKKKNI